MTLIIGIKCSDGVVIGSDGAVTTATTLGQSQTITQQAAKLNIIGEHLVFGVSGPVGLSQAYCQEIEPLITRNRNKVPWTSVTQARQVLQAKLWTHAQAAWERASVVAKVYGAAAAGQDALHESLVGLPIGDEAHLIQFSHQCQAQQATIDLPFVAIGSGQKTADPFLAFIRRTFWPNQSPSLGDGIFAILWALDYSIKAQPGGIGDPVQLATLSLDGANWKAKILSPDELGPYQLVIQEVERQLPTLTRLREEPSAPIPES